MALEIRKTNGALLATLEDGTSDSTSSSLTLIGRRFAEFGKHWNENQVLLLENSSAQIPPLNPLVGQMWFDNTPGVKGMKVYVSAATGWQILSYSIDDSVSSTFENDMTFNGALVFGGTTTFNNLSTFTSASIFSSTVTFNGAVAFTGDLTFDNLTFTEDTSFTGDATFAQTVIFNGQAIFNSSTVFADVISFDNTVSFNDDITIIGGTIDGTIIGGASAVAGSFTTLDATGTVSFVAGTIDNIVIGGSTAAAASFTSVDIGGGTIDGTIIGGASAVAGSFSDMICTGGTIDGNVIGGVTPAAGNFTTLDLTAVLSLASYVVSGLPSVGTAGLIYVSNESGGATLAFSNGVNWLRIQDLAIVS